jgi:hypothetical protein
MINVFYNQNNEEIYLIDWSTSPVFEFSANFGPRYWDLSSFISSLFYFSFSTFFSYKVRKDLTQAFLSGYLKKSNLDSNIFLNRFQAFLSSYNYYKLYNSVHKSSKSIIIRFLIAYSNNRLNKFIFSLPELLE